MEGQYIGGTIMSTLTRASQPSTLHGCQGLAAKLATPSPVSKCTAAGGKDAGGREVQKGGLVETMSPQAALPFLPPPTLMSGLRQQQRQRRRSVASAQAAAAAAGGGLVQASNERLLARDLQPPQLAPAARWDSSFPILLCITHLCLKHPAPGNP